MTRRIIQREEWGARYDDGFHDRDLPVSETWLHHSVTIAPDLLPPFDDDYAAIRTLENIGESRFGGGISYTYAITPVGLVFEGHSAHRSGAHTLNRNDFAVAICWVGRYDTLKPTEAMILATAWLLVQLKRANVIREAKLNGGHGQAPGQSTDCPGQFGRASIARINTLAAAYERGELDLGDDDNVEVDDVSADEVLYTKKIVGPSGPTPYNLNDMTYWTNVFANLIPGIAEKLDAIGTVVSEIAKTTGTVQLTDAQLTTLGTRVSDQVSAQVTTALEELDVKLEELAAALAASLGQDKDVVKAALREFFAPVVQG